LSVISGCEYYYKAKALIFTEKWVTNFQNL
jgi:hypothetical protein